MKRIFLISFLAFVGLFVYGQKPIVTTRTNASAAPIDWRPMAVLNLKIPAYPTLAVASTPYNLGLDSIGAIIFTKDSGLVYVRSASNTWKLVGGNGSGNTDTLYFDTTSGIFLDSITKVVAINPSWDRILSNGDIAHQVVKISDEELQLMASNLTFKENADGTGFSQIVDQSLSPTTNSILNLPDLATGVLATEQHSIDTAYQKGDSIQFIRAIHNLGTVDSIKWAVPSGTSGTPLTFGNAITGYGGLIKIGDSLASDVSLFLHHSNWDFDYGSGGHYSFSHSNQSFQGQFATGVISSLYVHNIDQLSYINTNSSTRQLSQLSIANGSASLTNQISSSGKISGTSAQSGKLILFGSDSITVLGSSVSSVNDTTLNKPLTITASGRFRRGFWPSSSGWGLTGNAGTDATTNFIGTTDVQDFVLKAGGETGIKIKSLLNEESLNTTAVEMTGGTATGVLSTAMTAGLASGQWSTAMSGSTASGYGATALGLGILSKSYSENAVGTFNTIYTPSSTSSFNSGDRIFSVGNGINEDNRSNALTILKNGNAIFGNGTPTEKLTVDGTILTTNFYTNSATPSITEGSGAGTSPTVTIEGTNMGGLITITPGSTPATTSTLASITFSNSFAFPNNCSVILYPANEATSSVDRTQVVNVLGSSTGFVITTSSNALTEGLPYSWNYAVQGY